MDRAARTMLQAKLKNSKFGDEEFVELMVDEFEKKVCLSYLPIGSFAHRFVTVLHRPSVSSMANSPLM